MLLNWRLPQDAAQKVSYVIYFICIYLFILSIHLHQTTRVHNISLAVTKTLGVAGTKLQTTEETTCRLC